MAHFEIPHLRFKLNCSSEQVGDFEVSRAELLRLIELDCMCGLYSEVCAELSVPEDAAKLRDMKQRNSNELLELKSAEEDAAENHGEVEIFDAVMKRGIFFFRTGLKDEALETFETAAQSKAATSGKRIDIELERIKISIFWLDIPLMKSSIDEADKLLELGGDWDRRNRLKVLKGIHGLVSRDFNSASKNFLGAVATFTSTEIFSYETLAFYTVLSSMVALARVELKDSVIDQPDIRSVIHATPHLSDFVEALYECDYRGFFLALVGLYPRIAADRYVAPHVDWFVREMRIRAYSQFLESYRSVTIGSMSKAFGVSSTFLDQELSQFISAERLSAKIDKTSGVVETNRPDVANAQYQSVIKYGDQLLNRVQKLTRAINA